MTGFAGPAATRQEGRGRSLSSGRPGARRLGQWGCRTAPRIRAGLLRGVRVRPGRVSHREGDEGSREMSGRWSPAWRCAAIPIKRSANHPR